MDNAFELVCEGTYNQRFIDDGEYIVYGRILRCWLRGRDLNKFGARVDAAIKRPGTKFLRMTVPDAELFDFLDALQLYHSFHTSDLGTNLDELTALMNGAGYRFDGMYKVLDGGLPDDDIPTFYRQIVFVFNQD